MIHLQRLIDFISSHVAELLEQTMEHLWLTSLSLLLATSVGVALGILIAKNKRLASPVLTVVNGVQTVPSIALLGFFLPFLGIGVYPAIAALFLYALLPIVRNTYTGITGIDAAIVEASRGMGLSDMQMLRRVELPLAMPVIFAGIRTAFVINVGVATLCALIAAGGLGEFIFRGLSTNNPYMILAGAIPAAVMALTFDALMAWVQQHLKRGGRVVLTAFILLFGVLAAIRIYDSDDKRLKGGFPSEFIGRSDGYEGLRDTYGLDLEVHEMEIGLMYDAVRNGDVDVISGFSTDGRIKAYDLLTLVDDKGYFPPYHAAPLIRGDLLARYPELRAVFNYLEDTISDTEMTALNYQVDQEHKDITQVARDFLMAKGLRASVKRNGPADVIVGSKAFTESFLLAEMYKIVIENYTGLTVDLKLGFGGTKLLFDAMHEGAVDIYPEYTGTGLLVILQQTGDIRYQKEAVLAYVREEFKTRYHMHWLAPHGFNNTFALLMRRSHAEQMGVLRISDLSP